MKPFIRCIDFWPVEIPDSKLKAYKSLIADKMIRNHHVIYNRDTGSTVVEYYAIMPHEWVKDELRKREIKA